MKIFPLVLTPLILGTALHAQETKVRTLPPDAQLDRKLGEETFWKLEEATGKVVRADGTVTTHAAPTLSSHAGIVVSTRPARLAPGQSGTLIVVLSLQGDAVVMPGAGLSLEYPQNQGPLRLGAWTVMPPRPGRIYPHFKDRPLHETFVQIEIPIAVESRATYNLYPVKLDLEVEVISGMSGTSLGAKKGNVQHQVTVGNPMPTPVPRVPVVRGDTVEIAHGAGRSDGLLSHMGRTDARGGIEVATVHPAATTSPGTQERAGVTADKPGETDGQAPRPSDNVLLYGVGGVAGLGLIVLLLARGRR